MKISGVAPALFREPMPEWSFLYVLYSQQNMLYYMLYAYCKNKVYYKGFNNQRQMTYQVASSDTNVAHQYQILNLYALMVICINSFIGGTSYWSQVSTS